MMNTPDWITQARASFAPPLFKIADSKDDKAIAEAFAQQAYTAIGNRDRAIMCDPFLLGFEVVDKNEENNRLIGVFAFRVGGEILLATVFYLSGQIKGQDLLYRKGVNRFCPNNEKWVAFLLGKADDETGRGIDRRGAQDGRITLGLERISQSPMSKYAFVPGEADPWKAASAEDRSAFIQQLYKEAMEAWTVTEPQHLFADMIVEQGMQKAAADLAARHHQFADFIELGKLLEHAKSVKVAAAPSPSLVLHLDPKPGLDEAGLEAFYKRGFAIEDTRDLGKLTKGLEESPMTSSWSTLREPGVQKAVAVDGAEQQVLWAPVFTSSSCYGEVRPDFAMVLLSGPDKGCTLRYGSYSPSDELPVFGSGDQDPETDSVKGESPKVGSAYMIWLPGLQRLWGPYAIGDKSSGKGVTRYNFETGASSNHGAAGRLVVNTAIETTEEEDFAPDDHQLPRICGKDAIFVPINADIHYAQDDGPGASKRLSYVDAKPPGTFRPMSLAQLNRALMKTKKAAVRIDTDRTTLLHDIYLNGRKRAADLTTPQLAVKLATALRLHGDEACELAVRAKSEKISFEVVRNADLPEIAAALFKGAGLLDGIADPGFATPGMPAGRANTGIPMPNPAAGRANTGIPMPNPAAGRANTGVPMPNPSLGQGPTNVSPKFFEMLGPARPKPLSPSPSGAVIPDDPRLRQQPVTPRAPNPWVRPKPLSPSPSGAVISDDPRQQPVTPPAPNPQAGSATPAMDDVASRAQPAPTHHWTQYEGPMNPSTTTREGWKPGDAIPSDAGDAEDWNMHRYNNTPEYQYWLSTQPDGVDPSPPPAFTDKEARDGFMGAADNAPPPKTAAAYFDRDLDPDSGMFDEYDYDQDLQIPVEHDYQNRHQALAYHEQQPRRVPRFGDSYQPQGGRNSPHSRSDSQPDHVPDDVILRMANPGMELAELGQQLGMQTLIDHGAVGSLAKVFDAGPYITEYIGNLEGSLDYLARLLFMLFWKPRDFAKLYGSDDIPQLESKLVGVFNAYGDLVLELMQSVGSKTE